MENTLTKAAATVDSNRQEEYGDPVENWVATAIIATVSQRKCITPEDVIQVMCGAKMVRAGRSHKEDTNIDQAGYAEIRERVQKAFADGTVQKIVEKLLGGWVKFTPPAVPSNAAISQVDQKQYDYGIFRNNMAEPAVYVTVRLDSVEEAMKLFGKNHASIIGKRVRID
jgi:hypothetical protein